MFVIVTPAGFIAARQLPVSHTDELASAHQWTDKALAADFVRQQQITATVVPAADLPPKFFAY